ncbi:hypothetical protein DW742_00860 [Butyricicoccus sp. AM28-25]|nr:hypothetical protein [Butyricicoccus sp. AM28-25]RHT78839.1 hypothetical protein DW742_00860 [Butyricicoccus sp. AM28-25]
MKKIFTAAASVFLFIALLTGVSVVASVVTQNTYKPSADIKILRSKEGSGTFCDICGKELSNRERGEKYQITFFQGRIVEESYNLVCPDCADNIEAYIEQLGSEP